VKTDHFAHHHAAAGRLRADLDNVEDFAFHVDRGFEHARRLDQVTGDGCESGDIEFADAGSIIAGGQVHLPRDLFRDDVDHKFGRGCDVAQRVLERMAVGDAEHEHGRLATNGVEKTEGREVGDAIDGNGGDEADGARNDNAGEYLIGDGEGNCLGIDDH
jgi:hypothetical protein